MSTGRGECPACGLAFNARESSIGTMRRCQGCGARFVLRRTPTSPVTVAVILLAAGFCIWRMTSSSTTPAPDPAPSLAAHVVQIPAPSIGTPAIIPAAPQPHASSILASEPADPPKRRVVELVSSVPEPQPAAAVIDPAASRLSALDQLKASSPEYVSLLALVQKQHDALEVARATGTTQDKLDAGKAYNDTRAKIRIMEARAVESEVATRSAGDSSRPAAPSPTTQAAPPTMPNPDDDRRSVLPPSSGGGTEHVKSYTRKDGTVVKSYDRAAPGRGKK